jgi:hypothetical protein
MAPSSIDSLRKKRQSTINLVMSARLRPKLRRKLRRKLARGCLRPEFLRRKLFGLLSVYVRLLWGAGRKLDAKNGLWDAS